MCTRACVLGRGASSVCVEVRVSEGACRLQEVRIPGVGAERGVSEWGASEASDLEELGTTSGSSGFVEGH